MGFVSTSNEAKWAGLEGYSSENDWKQERHSQNEDVAKTSSQGKHEEPHSEPKEKKSFLPRLLSSLLG